MTIERAIEILDPEHREHYESIEPVNEACRMGMNALKELSELKDKLKSGQLVELPCKVGDTATAIIDTLAYDNSIENVKIKGLAYIVEDENGDTTFQHINRVFSNEEQAKTKLKELEALNK